MYVYKFEEVKLSGFTGNPKQDYEEIVEKYVSQGYRLHTFAPLPIGAGGQAMKIQLIFERKQNSNS